MLSLSSYWFQFIYTYVCVKCFKIFCEIYLVIFGLKMEGITTLSNFTYQSVQKSKFLRNIMLLSLQMNDFNHSLIKYRLLC